MANEITVSASLRVSKGGISISRQSGTVQRDMSGDAYKAGVQSVSESAHEALDIPAEIGTEGWAWFKNLDATNYVTIGVDVGGTFYPVVKLKPADIALFRFGTTAPYAKADTAACNLEMIVIED